MGKVNINTSQNVQISYNIANIGERMLAYLIDALIVIAITAALVFIAIGFAEATDNEAFFLIIILAAIPYFFYHLICEIAMNGQSVGKRVRDLKVVSYDGTEPRISQYILRWLLRIVDIPFYGIVAILCIVIGNKGQRLGDIVAGTTVIKLSDQKHFLDNHAINEIDDNYQPVFMEAGMLSEKHISVIKKTIAAYNKNRDYNLLISLSDIIKKELNIESSMDEQIFLQTIVKDYHYLNSMG